MALEGSAVYCTLLLSDHYLPGAMVLAHSLRDNGSKAKLVALYTPDMLRPATITELQTVYDELIPVNSMTNGSPANLWLMERPDLIATFTKIELWRQTQYQRIVYIDCDVIALRAPDELLSLDVDFGAAPDVGWPDIFNSGVMVLRPNMQDYYSLRALAERGISFDGADQGLLNMHFRDWHRLSFTYNCTPSANYQYIPAYKHFQSTISLIHFIGAQKPWNMPRQVTPLESPYNQLLGRWWAVYDKHYRPATSVPLHHLNRPIPRQEDHQFRETEDIPVRPQVQITPPVAEAETGVSERMEPESVAVPLPEPQSVQHVEVIGSEAHEQSSQDTKPLSSPEAIHVENVDIPQEPRPQVAQAPIWSAVPQYVYGEEHVTAYIEPTREVLQTGHPALPPASIPSTSTQPPDASHHAHQPPVQHRDNEQYQEPPAPEPEEQVFEAPKMEWDASREPPPLNTKPEGIALQSHTYEMSEDTQLFKPPASYPEAPKNMYYKVPITKPEPQKATQIFPWESIAPKPSRVFPEDEQVEQIEQSPVSTSTVRQDSPAPSTKDESGPSVGSWTSWASEEHVQTESYVPPESFENYSRSNAWDEIPEIRRYIQSIQPPRKVKTQVLSGASHSSREFPGLDRNFRVTDFPSENDRPSLSVTPAPIGRPSFWSQGEGTTELGPNQEDWVGITVDAFSNLLQASYSLWKYTEPVTSPRVSAEV